MAQILAQVLIPVALASVGGSAGARFHKHGARRQSLALAYLMQMRVYQSEVTNTPRSASSAISRKRLAFVLVGLLQGEPAVSCGAGVIHVRTPTQLFLAT
jgi:hypothetical protein